VDSALTPSGSFFSRNQFLILRLHSLSGLVPVGAYMCVHLLTNASVLAGAATFQNAVDQIHSLGPVLPLVEWAFIFLPIIFHAVVGVVIVKSGISNTSSYAYAGNIRYSLQRITAWIALFFIFYHVFHLHGWIHADWFKEAVVTPLGGGKFDPHHATSSAGAALASFVTKLIYAVGVLSCVYHLANGIWTAGITWGLWTTPAAQKRANYVCLGFGIFMAVVGLSALVGMGKVDINQAKAIEDAREEQKSIVEKRAKEIVSKQTADDKKADAKQPAENKAAAK
jgi:succinate dehydrogenase / fumarate reductase cytochrome b subunit